MTNLFSPKGRIGRLEFLLTQLLANALAMGNFFLSTTVFEAGYPRLSFGLIFLEFVIVYMSICSLLKRAHDLYPAVNPWLLFIPIYNAMLFLVLLLSPGKKGVNSYGPSPYAIKRHRQHEVAKNMEE